MIEDWTVSVSMPAGKGASGTRRWITKASSAAGAIKRVLVRDNRFKSDFDQIGMVLLGTRKARPEEIKFPLTESETRLIDDTTNRLSI